MMTAGLALQTWLHRVPAGAKLAGLALLSVLLLPVGDWRTLVGALAMIALVYAGCGRVGMARHSGVSLQQRMKKSSVSSSLPAPSTNLN